MSPEDPAGLCLADFGFGLRIGATGYVAEPDFGDPSGFAAHRQGRRAGSVPGREVRTRRIEQRLYDLTDAAEMRWLRRITHSPRAVPEEWVPYHRRRRARALQARSLYVAGGAWKRVCTGAHGILRHPAFAVVHWRVPRWWRSAQVLQSAGAGHEPDPRTNWWRTAEYAITQSDGARSRKG